MNKIVYNIRFKKSKDADGGIIYLPAEVCREFEMAKDTMRLVLTIKDGKIMIAKLEDVKMEFP